MNVITRTMCALLLTVGGLSAAHAGVQIVGTRVVYPAGQREVTVRVLNTGDSPRLLQAWTDGGNDKEAAETSTAPFLVTPPISRVEPGRGQSLRIMLTSGDSIAQDRESIFWLNVVEIPPKPEDDDRNFLQFAVRSRIKIFYRPKALPGDPVASIKQLSWRMVSQGGQTALECTNNTAFNVSFGEVRLKGAPERAHEVSGGGTCPAKGQASFPVQGGADSGRLTYKAIDDYGALIEGEAAYTH